MINEHGAVCNGRFSMPGSDCAPARCSRAASDEDLAQKLWEISCNMLGITWQWTVLNELCSEITLYDVLESTFTHLYMGIHVTVTDVLFINQSTDMSKRLGSFILYKYQNYIFCQIVFFKQGCMTKLSIYYTLLTQVGILYWDRFLILSAVALLSCCCKC